MSWTEKRSRKPAVMAAVDCPCDAEKTEVDFGASSPSRSLCGDRTAVGDRNVVDCLHDRNATRRGCRNVDPVGDEIRGDHQYCRDDYRIRTDCQNGVPVMAVNGARPRFAVRFATVHDSNYN